MFRSTISRRDALLIFLGACSIHIWSLIFYNSPGSRSDQSILIDTHSSLEFRPAVARVLGQLHLADTTTLTVTTTTTTVPTPATENTALLETKGLGLPRTTLGAHAPGWTIFENLYMSNGTLLILTSTPKEFPDIRMMTSTGLEAVNTPENIAAREPTRENMDFITPEDALERWGGKYERGTTTRIWVVEGNTLLLNDPKQFLRHYYHFVAELFFGVQAFWHGMFSQKETATSEYTAQELAFSGSSSLHPAPPKFDRAIFMNSNADGWRDDPGFNSYFIRGVYPSIAVEHKEDWADRVKTSGIGDRAWLLPIALLVDRSAAHRGRVCGSLTQRTASEAWEGMHKLGKLRGRHAGGWWAHVRKAMWEFAGVPLPERKLLEIQVPRQQLDIRGSGKGMNEILRGVGVEAQKFLGAPETIVVTYISRQNYKRQLTKEDHYRLVEELKKLVEMKNGEAKKDKKKKKWELNVIEAEKMTKDEQVRIAAKTTFMLGVHGNGLTHLVWMKPTRFSTVIEIFYPQGFAHDYQWTSRALGMAHYAVWNDTYYTHPTELIVNYPDGFQGSNIPVYGPTIAKLIEDRVEGQLTEIDVWTADGPNKLDSTSESPPFQGMGLQTRAGSNLVSHFHSPAAHIFQPRHVLFDSVRSVSTSPYGRTHVWKRRLPVLPSPVVPKYEQTVIRSDGSSFSHWITSPKSRVRLTRDTTNNPLWNTANWANERTIDEESGSTGRMGRFSRKFGGTTLPMEVMTTKIEEKEKKDVEAKEDMTGGMDMAMGGSMGGVLDDMSWYEQMAELTGGESEMPGKGKKKKKD